ncbi:DUF6010 family protein [Nonomuraea wenchangensis]|uniref:DUF6010 family protein n=1 Tax=Nonomuraea wenchangensis TaxID=568860 RepID=UPI0037A710D6
MSILMPILIGIVCVCLLSLIPDPHRRRFNAVLVAGVARLRDRLRRTAPAR